MSADRFDRDDMADAAWREDWTPSPDALTQDPECDPWHRPRNGLLSNEVPFRPDLRLLQSKIVA